MKLIDAHAQLVRLNQPVLRTADAAACLKISNPHASQILLRLSQSGHLIRLKRSLFAFMDKLNRLLLPEFLTAPFPSYISLQTALSYHGMISQIPETIYAVSLARTHKYHTPIGMVSIHHIQPDCFFGFETKTAGFVKIATPEKALFDIFYFSPVSSRLFRSLPELEGKIGIKKIHHMIQKVKSVRRRSLVRNRLATYFAHSP